MARKRDIVEQQMWAHCTRIITRERNKRWPRCFRLPSPNIFIQCGQANRQILLRVLTPGRTHAHWHLFISTRGVGNVAERADRLVAAVCVLQAQGAAFDRVARLDDAVRIVVANILGFGWRAACDGVTKLSRSTNQKYFSKTRNKKPTKTLPVGGINEHLQWCVSWMATAA